MSGRILPLPAAEEEESDGVCGTQQQIKRRIENPSSSKLQYAEFILPDLCLEEVAIRVALDAVRDGGKIAAAPALTAFFQVCSSWQGISLFEHFWRELTLRIWSWTPRRNCDFHSWREEFRYLHQRAFNFHYGCYAHTQHSLRKRSRPDPIGYSYRLALSDHYLVASSVCGVVQVYTLPSIELVATHTLTTNIIGLILMENRLVFASEDGDICITHINVYENCQAHVRLFRAGNRAFDGFLVDFTGDRHRWVGLYARLWGFSWRVWDGETEQELYVGKFIVNGMWISPSLLELQKRQTARIYVVGEGLVVMGTRGWVRVMRIDPKMEVIAEMEIENQSVYSMSASNNKIVSVKAIDWVVTVREAGTLEEVGRFDLVERSQANKPGCPPMGAGCMNKQFAIMWEDKTCGRVCDVEVERYLYDLKPRLTGVTVAAANERFVVACTRDDVHVWDFGGNI